MLGHTTEDRAIFRTDEGSVFHKEEIKHGKLYYDAAVLFCYFRVGDTYIFDKIKIALSVLS